MECYSPVLPTLPMWAFHATRLNELCRIWPLNSALAALFSQSTKSKSPVKCYMHPANSWTQGCHGELSLMAGSESSPSNYAPPSRVCVCTEESKNHKKSSTADHKMGLAPVCARSRSLGAVFSRGLLTPGEEADPVLQAGVYCYGSPGSTNQLQTAAMINPYVL